ncbi:MAG: hypothetical protein CM1200mP40_18170 [Gammaproteobacteria bacterium]|nr:MAG: hypothetical protein CM1200mP40_18170 [Gammaproteobacteria bacterium]
MTRLGTEQKGIKETVYRLHSPYSLFLRSGQWTSGLCLLGGFERTVGGIFSASEVLLVFAILVYGTLFLVQRSLDKFQWITLGGVVVFCTLTIAFPKALPSSNGRRRL